MARNAAAQVDYVRSKIRSSKVFTDTGTIYRDGEAISDGEGGFTNVTTTQTNILCRYDALSAYELTAGGAHVIAGATHKLMFMPGTDIKAKDKFVVNARGDVPALTFFIIGRRESAARALLIVDAKLDGENSNV